jgi:hypothetical protein
MAIECKSRQEQRDQCLRNQRAAIGLEFHLRNLARETLDH